MVPLQHHMNGANPLVSLVQSGQIKNLSENFMFNQYTIISPRFSDCLDFAAVNLLQGRVIVRFKESGVEYLYKNVSRRRILALLVDPNKSLGFWGQYLFKNAIQENRYRPATGAMTYNRIGCSYTRASLPQELSTLQVA